MIEKMLNSQSNEDVFNKKIPSLSGNCESCRLVAHSNVEHLRKIDVYRAVSSEVKTRIRIWNPALTTSRSQAFLWLATSDPFAAAAALATDLEQSIDDDNVEFVVS